MFARIWTADLVRQHILTTAENEPLNYYYYIQNYPSVHAAAERIFGSWRNAVEACGFDYSTVRKYKRWNKVLVVEKIRELETEKIPLTSNHNQKNNKPLYMASIKYYGSWGKAVQAAGICYADVRLRRKLSLPEIKSRVINLYNTGADLSYTSMRKNHQYLLAYAMKKIGSGSWGNARKICGIHDNFRIPKAKRG